MSKLYARLVAATVIWVVFLSVWAQQTPTGAQTAPTAAPATCKQFLSDIEKNLSTDCTALDQNQSCYGNIPVGVQFQDPNAQLSFNKIGDIVPVTALKQITTGPLNIERNEWGIAVLKIPVSNMANTAAGQVVTFLLYGDTNLTGAQAGGSASPAATASAAPVSCTASVTRATNLRAKDNANSQIIQLLPPNAPLNVSGKIADGSWLFAESGGKTGWIIARNVQLNCDASTLPVQDPSVPASLPGVHAFYFSTGVSSQAACNDIPQGGLLVQSPHGLNVNFQINGVDITMGSTVIFEAAPNGKMTISVVEGQITVIVNGKRVVIPAGQSITMPLGGINGLEVDGPPGLTQPANGNALELFSVCKVAQAVGLNVPCALLPPATPTVLSTTCTERTFRSDGTVCIPGYGIFPCNRNGVCDPGEHSYICPEDCGAPPPPQGWGQPAAPTSTDVPTATPYYGYQPIS